MKKIALLLVIVLINCLFISNAFAVSAQEDIDYTVDVIIAQAEDFFMSLKQGKYDTAWSLLSEESRNRIIDDIYDTYQNMGGEIRRSAIEQDFEKSGMIFKNYWNSFVRNVDVLMILDDCRWQPGVMKETKADIIITYMKSKNPLILHMVKENDLWKVGLVETFWNSRTMDILQAIMKFI
ncbi:MAG: hypothetical protein AB1499_14900 [Nitrospirota bacterium]